MKYLILLFGLLTVQCHAPKKKETSAYCEKCKIISAVCMERYDMDNNYKHLDTALIYINKALLSCNKEKKKYFTLRKLAVLSMKKDFDQALVVIKNMDTTYFYAFPYFNNLLKNRFIAMKAQSENKIIVRDSALRISIIEIGKFLTVNKLKIDSLLQHKNVNDVFSNPLSTAFTEYYYYKSIIEGSEKVKQEISNKQRQINGNEEYFKYVNEFLSQDFMVFIGI